MLKSFHAALINGIGFVLVCLMMLPVVPVWLAWIAYGQMRGRTVRNTH